MKGKFGRSIALVTAASLLAVATAGIASASPGEGKGSAGTQALAAQVLQMRDDLIKVAYAGNAGATRAELEQLSPVLADIAAGQRYTAQTGTEQLAGLAKGRADESARLLAAPTAEPRQLAPIPDGPLKIVSDLLKALLALLNKVLGALGLPPLLPQQAVSGV